MSDQFYFDSWGSEMIHIDGKLVWWRYPFEFPPSLMSDVCLYQLALLNMISH